jgi:hypothetical protein
MSLRMTVITPMKRDMLDYLVLDSRGVDHHVASIEQRPVKRFICICLLTVVS